MALADRLRDARRRRFVGRRAELELFEQALEGTTPFAVLFVHGPGGVGKSALLGAFAEAAERRGVPVTRVDLRAIDVSPPGFEAAVGPPPDGPRVLLLDTYEAGAGLDLWLRERFLPSLRDDVRVVIAGRDPPSAAWRADAGWRELLRVVSLRNLDPDDARVFLRVEGVPELLHEGALAVTHGHPLALRLFVDVLAQGKAPAELASAPDVVRELLERFAADAPSPRHRLALDACAHARATTEDLLRGALGGDDAAELFAWLRTLSFVEEGPDGVFPHDIARAALDADLRWRDRERYSKVHRGIRRHVIDRVQATTGTDQQRAVADLIFLHRGNAFAAAFWDWESFGLAYPDALRPGEDETILAMIERHETPESRALAEHWLEHQPEAFSIFRAADEEPIGFTVILALHAASEAAIAADPGASTMWEHVRRHGILRPGDEVHAGRWFMDAEAYQAPSASFNVFTIVGTHLWMTRPRIAWDLLGMWTDAEAIEPIMRYIDHPPEAFYEVGGMRYGVFAHDWRQVPLGEWLDLMAGREFDADFALRESERAPLIALSQPEFAAAARQALRDLHRADALAANPLTRTRMAVDAPLVDLIEQAVAALRADPRDAKLARALERTYVRPAPTQERAAELLDLPFSTYRRHLTRGVERVVEWLWARELHGAS